jgi:regulator of replication initiation timing
MMVPIVDGKTSLGRPKKELISLTDLIGNEIVTYQSTKDSLSQSYKGLPKYQVILLRSTLKRRLYDIACRLSKHIELARTNGLIKNVGLTNRIKELEEENERLKVENDKLQTECKRLNDLNEALHKTLDRFGQRSDTLDTNEEE